MTRKYGDDVIRRLTEAIAAETPVDWEEERAAHPDQRPRMARLRVIERIAEFHRTPVEGRLAAMADTERAELFTWGHLSVLEKIGDGSFGDVYRAHDPLLRRDVALKLLREDRAGPIGARRFVDEAGRMARIRHPNVLVIHGAAEHEGRIGFWTDLLEGMTLAERLEREGPMSAGEAATVGIELCRALAAVHAAGLVHGDVTASNVVRAAGGRHVLVDFGAGSDAAPKRPAAASLASVFGTPLTLAPEVLRGEASSSSADLYALGVLLFRLVCGRYPVDAETMGELLEKHRRRERTRLRDARAELPADFVRVVESALAEDPARRPSSAGAMEEALAATLGHRSRAAGPSARSGVRRLALVAAAAIVVTTLVVGVVNRPATPAGELERAERTSAAAGPGEVLGGQVPTTPSPATAPPAGALTASLTLHRSRGGAKETLPAGTIVHPGDALFMELRTSEPAHAYVLNEDAAAEVFVLFPLEALDLQNPLDENVWHRLPGARDGVRFDWQVTSGHGTESFLVVVSRRPLADLQAAIAALPAAELGRPVQGARIDPAPLLGQRGVGGVLPGRLTPGDGSARTLDAIARRLGEDAGEPGGIWIRQLSVYNLGS